MLFGGDAVSDIKMKARQAAVLYRAGLVPVRDPLEIARSSRDVRRLGPIAGPLAIASRRHPDTPGLIDDAGILTFRELELRVHALARGLRNLGISADDTIGVLCRDSRTPIEALAAAGRLGAGVVLMNTGFGKGQLADVSRREGVCLLITDEEFRDLCMEVGVPTVFGGSSAPGISDFTTESLIASESSLPLPFPDSVGRLIMLTSGTTGTPKGAPRQVRSPLAAAQFLDRIPLRADSPALLCAPIFHGTGLSIFLLSLSLGCTTIVHRRFDPAQTLSSIETYRARTVVLVPTMLQRILALGDKELQHYDTSSLRVLFCAGSALAPAVGNHATRLFGDVIYNLYGSTEVAVAAVATPDDWRRAPGTVGRTPVGCRCELLDDNGERITEAGRTGRVFVSSGLSFEGYTGGGNKEVIDGLLSSGDIGHLDEFGLLHIDGRDDDMIVSGGENVYPAEIESALISHGGIADAAVLGVPDEEFGQRLHAVVVRATGSTVTEEELRAHIRTHLARFKVPRVIEFRDSLPRNATGKLLRNELRAESQSAPD